MDRATRYGLYVPVTTIGIAPIRTETNGRRIRRLTCKSRRQRYRGVTKGRWLADVPQMTWFAPIKMLLWRLVDKMVLRSATTGRA
jgi:hypothetical protein